MTDDGNGSSVSINFVREIWTSVAITEGPKLHDKCIKKLAISRTFGDVFMSLTDDRWIQSENVDGYKVKTWVSKSDPLASTGMQCMNALALQAAAVAWNCRPR